MCGFFHCLLGGWLCWTFMLIRLSKVGLCIWVSTYFYGEVKFLPVFNILYKDIDHVYITPNSHKNKNMKSLKSYLLMKMGYFVLILRKREKLLPKSRVYLDPIDMYWDLITTQTKHMPNLKYVNYDNLYLKWTIQGYGPIEVLLLSKTSRSQLLKDINYIWNFQGYSLTFASKNYK